MTPKASGREGFPTCDRESLTGIQTLDRSAAAQPLAGRVRISDRFLVHYSQVIHMRLWRLRRSGLTLVSGVWANKEKGDWVNFFP